MSRIYSVYDDPYNGLAESVRTSNVLSMADAFDWSYSWNTTSGATAQVELQLSNDNPAFPANPAEASWSRWTIFGETAPVPASNSTIKFPPLGVRYVRFVREVSGASFQIHVNKFVNS